MSSSQVQYELSGIGEHISLVSVKRELTGMTTHGLLVASGKGRSHIYGIAVTNMKTPYEKALTALLGVSYIQPFEDGNKRTARLMANALLFAYGCVPLSYRSVEEKDYREACLVFYELNSMMPFKDIFLGQYEFAAKNYAVSYGPQLVYPVTTV